MGEDGRAIALDMLVEPDAGAGLREALGGSRRRSSLTMEVDSNPPSLAAHFGSAVSPVEAREGWGAGPG